MAHYTFRIRQGSHSSDVPVHSVDDDAAWDEAAGACSDMIRDTIARLRDSPDGGWRSRTIRRRAASFPANLRDLRSVRPPQLATDCPAHRLFRFNFLPCASMNRAVLRGTLFRFVSGVRFPRRVPPQLAASSCQPCGPRGAVKSARHPPTLERRAAA